MSSIVERLKGKVTIGDIYDAIKVIEQQEARIREMEARVPVWIPVSERLPEPGQNGVRSKAVYVWCPAIKCHYCATYDHSRRAWEIFGSYGATLHTAVEKWSQPPAEAQEPRHED